MTEAAVEKIARLMHAEALEFWGRADPAGERGVRIPFDELAPEARERYRFVARKVLKALGH